MRILIISPTPTLNGTPATGIPNLQQEALRRILKQEGHEVEPLTYESVWKEHPDLPKLNDNTLDGDFLRVFHQLVERCGRSRARMLFDLRRINDQFPENLCRFFKLAALGCNLVDALITPSDETLLRNMFPPAFGDMPALLGSNIEMNGYYRRRSHTASG